MEIKERVATTVEYVVRCYGHSMSGDADITSENAMFATDEILRALAEAGPTEKMVEAGARELFIQDAREYADESDDVAEWWDTTDTRAKWIAIARAAIAAALKEMT